MNILEQCKRCEKRPMCRLGEHEYYQVAFEHWKCPYFKQKQVKTVPITNFDRITESPEAMAEKLVYSAWDGFHGDRWSGIVNGIRFAFNTKEEAITATLKWLNKEDGNEKTNP